MKWYIPAKTFLVGEYAALVGASALVLTTVPCFEFSLKRGQSFSSSPTIHPESPAGRWLTQNGFSLADFSWYDPYHQIGGLGASSAQFIGAYLAACHLRQVNYSCDTLLEAYYQCAWQGNGLKPSGYDLLAQTQCECVYLNRQKDILQHYHWPFKDIAFLLIHSGKKQATHTHLETLSLAEETKSLAIIAQRACLAFDQIDSSLLIDAVNTYQQQLEHLALQAPHSSAYVKQFKTQSDILAAKGCGALGADVLLLIVPANRLTLKIDQLSAAGWIVLATNNDLYSGDVLLKSLPEDLKFCSNSV